MTGLNMHDCYGEGWMGLATKIIIFRCVWIFSFFHKSIHKLTVRIDIFLRIYLIGCFWCCWFLQNENFIFDILTHFRRMFQWMLFANYIANERKPNISNTYWKINVNGMTLIYLSFFSFLIISSNLFFIRFKNGQPYPWSTSLILYPQAENQTIYTRHATINDNANYTCVIRNDTHKTEHVIEFTVQGIYYYYYY